MRYVYTVTCLALACSGTDPAAAPEPIQPAAELCFRVDPEVLAAFPAAEERLAEAGAAWGWPVRIDSSCSSALILGEPPNPKAGAQHVPGWRSVAWDGGSSVITLRRAYAELGKLSDLSADDCRALPAALGQRVTLATLLIHELGHAFVGQDHLPEPDSVMRPKLLDCEVARPTPIDLATAAALVPPPGL
jgi:hypothetical protein